MAFHFKELPQPLADAEQAKVASAKRHLQANQQLDKARAELEIAKREGNLAKAGELSYGVIPQLEKQLAELKLQRAEAKSHAGMWAQPEGEEWYRWALGASTTTNLTADEVHEQGLQELEELHGRMDPILREIGYTQGTVGERMAGSRKNKCCMLRLARRLPMVSA